MAKYYDLVETPKGRNFTEMAEGRVISTDQRVALYYRDLTADEKLRCDRGFDVEGFPILLEFALQEDDTRYSRYLPEPDEEGIYQPDPVAIEVLLASSERSWRDSEILWYNGYREESRWESLCCIDQEGLYRYYVSLLQYPQKVGFPNTTRPIRPILVCDCEKTDEQRWEGDIQLELNALRLSPLTINNAMIGSSGEEVSTTIFIAPSTVCMANMSAYITESVVNGLVDVLWDTDGGGQVRLTVQNLKPVFKACESYIGDLYKAKKLLVDAFGTEVDICDPLEWPSKAITLV